MHLVLFCTMTNKCTVISQIIILLHVSTLSCHKTYVKDLNCKSHYQQLLLKHLCNLARYWLQAPWGWHDSVETCRSVIICEIIVYLLVIVQNKLNKCVSYIIRIFCWCAFAGLHKFISPFRWHAFGTRKDTETQNFLPLTEHTSAVSWSHGAVTGWQLQAHESHLHLHTLL